MTRKGYITIIVILTVIIIGLSGFLIYDKIIFKEQKINENIEDNNYNDNQNNEENELLEELENDKEKEEIIDKDNNEQSETIVYNVNDYILIKDYKYNKNCSNCESNGIVKTIEFKNLPTRLTTDFLQKHQQFIHPKSSESAKLSNSFTYSIYKNILSIYTNETKKYEIQTSHNDYSLNIDLANSKIITNQELLQLYNINSNDIFEKILNNIADTVKTEEFLLSTDGDPDAETISIKDFKVNIQSYKELINNRTDVITLYIENGNLRVSYSQEKILQILGMGTHMNIGLINELQSITLN